MSRIVATSGMDYSSKAAARPPQSKRSCYEEYRTGRIPILFPPLSVLGYFRACLMALAGEGS